MQLNKLTDGFELVAEDGEERRLGLLYQCLIDHGFIHMKASGIMSFKHFGLERGELTVRPSKPLIDLDHLVILEKHDETTD